MSPLHLVGAQPSGGPRLPRVLTPVEYSFLTPEHLGNRSRYQRLAEKVGLDKTNRAGYGLLHCVDEDGKHWTCVTEDVEYLSAIESADKNILANLDIPPDKFPVTREGWPDEW